MTETIVNWMPLFSNPDVVSIIYDSFKFLIAKDRLLIYAYVIMENHLHLVASSKDMSKEIGDFKSFTAREIIDYYKERKAERILNDLAFYKVPHKKDREHQLWQEGSHPELIQNREMMIQKVTYIHNNPVKRGYVDDPAHWRYSSARNYAGMEGLLNVVTDW